MYSEAGGASVERKRRNWWLSSSVDSDSVPPVKWTSVFHFSEHFLYDKQTNRSRRWVVVYSAIPSQSHCFP